MAAIADRSAAPASSGGEDKGLKQGAIGLVSTTVIAISSAAPAYSLAAALGLIVIVPGMGFHSPVIILLAFIPMLFVAQGYSRLNKEMPDCGTTFTWGAKTFGPKTGWMGGWGIFAADIIVMANLAAIAGEYLFLLFGDGALASSILWRTVAGVGWIVVMCAICYIGIELGAIVQYGLLIVEITMLLVASAVALAKVYAGRAPAASSADITARTPGAGPHHIAWSWFNPVGVGSFSALAAGMLIAVFIYWGWDTAATVNEETKDKDKTPGRAVVLATIVLLFTFVFVSVATQAFAGLGTHGIGLDNPANSADVLSVLGGSVFGTAGFGLVLSRLLIFMVLTSAMASTLTTILPAARTALSMAVYKAFPARLTRIHPRFLTPTWATVGMAAASIVFYVLMTAISTRVLADLIAAIGFPIAFYYGLTGYECVWWYRRRLFDNPRMFIGAGLLPFLGAVILTALFGYACYYYIDPAHSTTSFGGVGTTLLTGIGTLALGVVAMLIWRARHPAYFNGEILSKGTPVLAAETAGAAGPGQSAGGGP